MRIALSKRADLSMSTIVMAIIALLILIVLATMIVRNLGSTNEQINQCENKGGTCIDAGASCEEEVGLGKVANPGFVCVDASKKADYTRKCCV